MTAYEIKKLLLLYSIMSFCHKYYRAQYKEFCIIESLLCRKPGASRSSLIYKSIIMILTATGNSKT